MVVVAVRVNNDNGGGSNGIVMTTGDDGLMEKLSKKASTKELRCVESTRGEGEGEEERGEQRVNTGGTFWLDSHPFFHRGICSHP